MGLIKLIKLGTFSALIDFSQPARSIALWAAFAIGIVVQIVLDRKAKKPEGRFVFAVVVVILMLICEFTQYGKILPNDPTVLFIYGMLVCMLVGLAIPAIALWLKNRSAKKDSPQPEDSADSAQNSDIPENYSAQTSGRDKFGSDYRKLKEERMRKAQRYRR